MTRNIVVFVMSPYIILDLLRIAMMMAAAFFCLPVTCPMNQRYAVSLMDAVK